MKVHGSRHCGRVKYEADIDPEIVGLCNCADCQMLTGTVFCVSVAAPSDSFRLLSGQLDRIAEACASLRAGRLLWV